MTLNALNVLVAMHTQGLECKGKTQTPCNNGTVISFTDTSITVEITSSL